MEPFRTTPGLETYHFHVCPKCLRYWGHNADGSHDCPSCGHGPVTAGHKSLRGALERRAELAAQANDPKQGQRGEDEVDG
jgi:PHP family Zn ribbon phosphoesterase